MSNIDVSTDAIRAYGKAAAGISAELAGAGAFDLAANMAAMTPVFGLIGTDYLAAFGVAQANHAKSYGDLATHFGGMAQTAHDNAAAYEHTDDSTAARLGNVANDLGA